MRSLNLDADRFLAALAPGRPVPIDAEAFAALWTAVDPTPDRLCRALRAAGAFVDVAQAVEVLLTVRELFAEFEGGRVIAEATGEAVFGAWLELVYDTTPGLHVDEVLDGRLPLLELAADIARHRRGCRLWVRAVHGLGHCDGLFSSAGARGAVILLDPLTSGSLAEVFAHELAHALDPELGPVNRDGREAFANTLAPLLLELQPTSIEEARPLVTRTLSETGRYRRPMPVAQSSVAEILTWALEEAIGWTPAPELIAAHVRAPQSPGVNVDPAATSSELQGGPGAKVPTTGRAELAPGVTCAGGAAGRAVDATGITEERC